VARLPRLALDGHAHWVIQRALPGVDLFPDDADRQAWLDAVRQACAGLHVQVHAWALLTDEVQLLLTPPTAGALSLVMQSVGRRYVSTYNRRHHRSGTLWDGRFRAAVVEPGAPLLGVLELVDGAGGVDAPLLHTSAAHRLGRQRMPLIVDPVEYWQLGNTPFEREAAWRARLAPGPDPARAAHLRRAALGGWVIGSPGFAAAAAAGSGRPATPRARGRPPGRRAA
jgi:putative transposase